MTIDLFFDTETTGLVNSKAPYSHPTQPDLVQLGFQVYDNKYPIFEYGSLINLHTRPDIPFTIEPKAQETHGISSEMLRDHGVPIHHVADSFMHWVKKSDRIIAHNTSFDIRVMATFFFRLGMDYDWVKDKMVFCTLNSTINLLKLPGPYGYKWPKLSEAYERIVDPKGFGNAHNALADVNACAKIFYKLEEHNKNLKGPLK